MFFHNIGKNNKKINFFYRYSEGTVFTRIQIEEIEKILYCKALGLGRIRIQVSKIFVLQGLGRIRIQVSKILETDPNNIVSELVF